MLHLPDTDLKETRFYREAFAEGEAEGELALVLRLLRRRLGVVSTGYEDRIRLLSLDYLGMLGEDLMDFRNHEDLVAWLERHAV